jgi:hypothetical protein
MHRTPENLRKVLDLLAAGYRLSHVMGAIGAHEKTIFEWLKRDDVMVDWPEGESPRLFRELAIQARKQSCVAFEQAMRSEVLHGIPRIVVEGGEVQYQLDPTFLGWTDDEMRALAFAPSERYLRDKDGQPMPLIVYDPAPAHLKIKMLTSLMPNTYGDRRTVDVNARINGGVLTIGAKPKEPLALAPPIEDDDEPLDHDDATRDRDTDSPLVRDLRKRLREGVRNPLPQGRGIVADPRDEDDGDVVRVPARPAPPRPGPAGTGVPPQRQFEREGIGHGDVVPGGFKTA